MTIRLRPHHLLCLLTYAGKGYGPAFTANYDMIVGRIERGEDIRIVPGPDDICTPLLHESDAHCRGDSVIERDRLATLDVEAVLARPVREGDCFVLTRPLVARMRKAFSAGRTRRACQGCQWSDFCTEVSAEGYKAARIHPKP